MCKIRLIVVLLSFHFISTVINAQADKCSRVTSFGEAQICLPYIEGYQECYTEAIVKKLADMTEVPANSVLGYYLNNDAYKRKDSLGVIRIEDYFKIYGTNQLAEYNAGQKELDHMEGILKGSFISENWETIKKDLDEIGLNADIGVPVVVKSYKLNDDSFTYVILTSYELVGGESYTLAATMNGLIVNSRLIWMAYYLDYKNESSIDRLEENSKKILTLLFSANK